MVTSSEVHVVDTCLEASKSQFHLALFDLIIDVIFQDNIKSVLYLSVIKVLLISNYMLNLTHLQQVLHFLSEQLLRHIYQNLELALIWTIVHLDDEALQRAEMLIIKELSDQHLSVIKINESSTDDSFGGADSEVDN